MEESKLTSFDSLIKPTLTYGSAVWSRDLINDWKKVYTPNNKVNVIDTAMNRFLKQTLNVSHSSTNNAILAELGRYPLSCTFAQEVLKYFFRLENMDHNRLNKQLHTILTNDRMKLPWYKSSLNLHELIDPELIRTNTVNKSHYYFKRYLKNTVETNFDDMWYSNLHNDNRKSDSIGNKLRTYRTFKCTIELEPYLNIIEDPLVRTSFTKFRISDHMLAIEQGRYKKVKLQQRICCCCKDNVIEDENHFLLSCELYKQNRKPLIKSCNANIHNFSELNESQKFQEIMKSKNEIIINKLAVFIHNSFSKRKHHLTYSS